MYCGLDLKEYKVEIKPVIEVSPKIHAEAKAEGIPYPKWKPKPERHIKMGKKELPVYGKFAKYRGKPFCPHCGNYDSLKREDILKIEHKKGESVTIDEYDVYTCLACGKQSLIFRGEVIDYLYLYGVGKVPVMSEKPEKCPNCHEPTVKLDKECYYVRKEKVDYYVCHKYLCYSCSNCNFNILVDSLQEEKLVKYPDNVVEILCESCYENLAHREDKVGWYKFKCVMCGKILCENCVRIRIGLWEDTYDYPFCASSIMCKVCGEFSGKYICSSLGTRI